MLAVKSYHCRFVDYKKPVYAIASYVDADRRFRESRYMTSAFHSNTKDTYNVLVAFECKRNAEWWCEQVGRTETLAVALPEPVEFVLDDFSYFANTLRVPLMVVLNSYCDLLTRVEEHEIFYTSRVLQEQDTYEF